VEEAVIAPMTTLCVVVYVPGAGLNVGLAVTGMIVYTAELTGLAESPVATAIALRVSVAETVIGLV
jgi:hypothetical protein